MSNTCSWGLHSALKHEELPFPLQLGVGGLGLKKAIIMLLSCMLLILQYHFICQIQLAFLFQWRNETHINRECGMRFLFPKAALSLALQKKESEVKY